jgi:hypothetical protein
MSLGHKGKKAGEPITLVVYGGDLSVSCPGDPFEDQIL